MSTDHSDALVFFGATGDLAFKKIFPALPAMIRRGRLDVPVIGVAKQGWTVEQLLARARESLATHGGGVDESAFAKLAQLLRYVDGDYADPQTFAALRNELGGAARPLHYSRFRRACSRSSWRVSAPRAAGATRAWSSRSRSGVISRRPRS